MHLTCCDRAFKGFPIGMSDHEDGARDGILSHHGDESVTFAKRKRIEVEQIT